MRIYVASNDKPHHRSGCRGKKLYVKALSSPAGTEQEGARGAGSSTTVSKSTQATVRLGMGEPTDCSEVLLDIQVFG